LFRLSKSLTALLVLIFVCATPISARSLFEVGIGLSGVYDTSSSAEEGFFAGMGNGKQWTIGIGVNTRFSFLDLAVVALMPYGETEETFSLLSTLSVSVPLVTDSLYVSVGTGLTTDFLYPEAGETKINGLDASSVSFEDVLYSSPIHLKFGLDVLIGSAKIGLFYLMNSISDLKSIGEPGGWTEILRSSKHDKIGLAIQLGLF